jgi:hypothetical protein
MKRNKKIIKINLIPLPSSNNGVLGRQPAIYIHYYQGGDSGNDNARKKWEAYLIVRLNPARQDVRHYEGRAMETGYKQSEKRWIEQGKEDKRKVTRRVCNTLRDALKQFSEAQKGHIPLSQRDIELKRRSAWQLAHRAITKLVNQEPNMVRWHNDVLYNYATNKLRIIENEILGPIKQ